MPFIQEFVDKHKAEPLKGLRIKYKQGAPPVLHLYDAEGNEASDPISISQWKTEHIVDFIQSKVKGA